MKKIKKKVKQEISQKRYFYNDEEEITSEEAHKLEDKSKIMTSKNPIKFKKEKK